MSLKTRESFQIEYLKAVTEFVLNYMYKEETSMSQYSIPNYILVSFSNIIDYNFNMYTLIHATNPDFWKGCIY